MYRRYIDPIHDSYRDTYRIIYSITNIAENVIKPQHTNTCIRQLSPIRFMQICEAVQYVS